LTSLLRIPLNFKKNSVYWEICSGLPTATFVNPGRSMRVKFTTADKTPKNNHISDISKQRVTERGHY